MESMLVPEATNLHQVHWPTNPPLASGGEELAKPCVVMKARGTTRGTNQRRGWTLLPSFLVFSVFVFALLLVTWVTVACVRGGSV